MTLFSYSKPPWDSGGEREALEEVGKKNKEPLLILISSKMVDAGNKFPGDAQESNVLSSTLCCITENVSGYQHFSTHLDP